MKLIDKEKLHQILSSLWENDDSVGKVYYNQALQAAQIAIDNLQEEPVSNGFEEALANEWKDYNDRGANWKEQQMMANAIDAHCFGFQGDALFSFTLPADNYLVGTQVKVIVIEED